MRESGLEDAGAGGKEEARGPNRPRAKFSAIGEEPAIADRHDLKSRRPIPAPPEAGPARQHRARYQHSDHRPIQQTQYPVSAFRFAVHGEPVRCS